VKSVGIESTVAKEQSNEHFSHDSGNELALSQFENE